MLPVTSPERSSITRVTFSPNQTCTSHVTWEMANGVAVKTSQPRYELKQCEANFLSTLPLNCYSTYTQLLACNLNLLSPTAQSTTRIISCATHFRLVRTALPLESSTPCAELFVSMLSSVGYVVNRLVGMEVRQRR